MILAVLQARMGSSRLPGKVMKPILGKPMLAMQLERVLRARQINRVVVATSTNADDDGIVELCQSLKIDCYRGNLLDVLDRFYQAAKLYQPTHVVRLTGDCPLIDPAVIDAVINQHLQEHNDYTTNALHPSFPDGLDVEIMRFECLEKAWHEARLQSEREHVTPFIYRQDSGFQIGHYREVLDLSHLRWTVDEPIDLELVIKIFETLYPINPEFNLQDVLQLIQQKPELATMNKQIKRNEGYAKSLANDTRVRSIEMSQRYHQSEQLLVQAERVIPLGSQTFSKSKTQLPWGVSPFFAAKGQGSRIWDVDENEYIDLVNSLAAVTLGYNYDPVDEAVKKQLKNGVTFSLPHRLEMEVAEKLIDMIPSAEMVRFGKNGSDATAGAVRLARAVTGRDHVAVCGYHGWQDWYIGSTAKSRGVPDAVKELTHTFIYNDILSLQKLFDEYPKAIAAVILEPMNISFPQNNYLAQVKSLCEQEGAILVFDEMITGFRFANGGAQEYFGVTPDLSTFGKGLANGFPLSAVVGRKDLMKEMEDIFFSFTFGGETLSLAAASAVLDCYKVQPVIKTLYARGEALMKGLNGLIEKNQMQHIMSLVGHPAWSIISFKDASPYTLWDIKTLFLQEMFARGIFTIGTHNMSFSHSESDIQVILAAYEQVLPMIRQAVTDQTLENLLQAKPLEPLFKVR